MKNNRKIKVLHIFHMIKYSGAEMMFHSAANYFQKNGIELHAIAAGPKKGDFAFAFEKAGIKVYHKPMYPSLKNYFLLIPYLFLLVEFLSRNRFDVVHIHRSKWFIWFAISAKLAGTGVIIRTIHNVFSPKLRYLQYFLDRRTAKILGVKITTIGPSVYLHELKYFGNRTIKINNWFNTDKFYPAINQNEKEKLRNRFNLPLNKFIIISVGSCLPEKRHKDIIESIAMLGNSKKLIHYIHLGHGPLHEEESATVMHLGLQDQVSFIGNTHLVREYLVSSDLFVMTSDFEGLPISGIEAMACSIPCLFYDSTGLRDLIQGNKNGMLIEPNVTSLSEYLMKFLSLDTDKLKKLGKEAFEFVNREYEMNAGATALMTLYNSNSKKLLPK